MSKRISLLEFGDFLLDTSQKALQRNGERISLSPRPMAMLLILVENRHRIVSHDELMARVWDGVIVEESNIATNIARLRKVLGNGEARQFIETVPGYGYQFVAEVREVEREQETNPQDSIVNPIPKPVEPTPVTPSPSVGPVLLIPPAYLNWKYWFGLAAVVALAFAAWNFAPSRKPFIDRAKIKYRDVVSWGNKLEDPILMVHPSPDGQMIAFTQKADGESDIFIQYLEKQEPQQITNKEWPGEDPIWAPYGLKIAYQSSRYGQGKTRDLVVFDLRTRQYKVLGTLNSSNSLRLLRWSGRENKIFYTDEKNVFVYFPETQQTINLTNFKEEKGGPSEFGLSLNEEKIAYIKTANEKRSLFVARVNGSQERELKQAGEKPSYPEWFPDHEHILYGSTIGGVYQVAVIGAGDDEPGILTAGEKSSFPYHLTPDGRQILYVATNGEGNLYRYDLERNAESDLVRDSGIKAWPDVSANGEVAFQSVEVGLGALHSGLYRANINRNFLSAKIDSDGFDPRWSPDGKTLAFMKLTAMGAQLWLLDSKHASAQLLTKDVSLRQGYLRTALQWHQPNNYAWSPDGSHLVFSAAKGEIVNLSALGVDGQPRPARSQNTNPKLSVLSPMWSPDGSRIAYLAQAATIKKGTRNLVINDGNQDRTIFSTDLPMRMIGWQDDIHFLVGLMEPTPFQLGHLRLKRVSLAGQMTEEAIDQSLSVYLYSLRLSPDGQTIAMLARQNDCDNVWLYSLTTRQLTQVTVNQETNRFLTGLTWLPDGKSLCYGKHSTSTWIKAIELSR